MRQPSLPLGALLGALTVLPVMALFYLGNKALGLPFVPFDLFDWLARVLPGDVITIGIDAIVKTIGALNLGDTSSAAKFLEQLMALAMVTGLGALLGVLLALALRRTPWSGGTMGTVGGLLLFILFFAIELNLGQSFAGGDPTLAALWMLMVLGGWGALLGTLLESTRATPEYPAERRAMLTKAAGGSFAVALGGWGVGRLLGQQIETSGAAQPLPPLVEALPLPPLVEALPPGPASPVAAVTVAATLRDLIPPAPGTRLELTPNDDFYRIDINTRPLILQKEHWKLQVSGLFERPRELSLDDLMAFPATTQTVTMGCISNQVGGDLIGTSNWTGVRLRDVLKDLGMQPAATTLYMESADGFFESVTMEDMMDPRTLLVYGMNGETLPVEHGFPLRIYIADRYGMKQPKWITRMEARDSWEPGYWVERGWSREARPQIVSVIDTIATQEVKDGQLPVGGIAWAGDRGIQKVEVQVDEEAWVEATLRTPPLSALTWIQWRYDWPATPGNHTL
nr:molybdopterin-dependent oxidoreductase [Ardenticatenales bacterium]